MMMLISLDFGETGSRGFGGGCVWIIRVIWGWDGMGTG